MKQNDVKLNPCFMKKDKVYTNCGSPFYEKKEMVVDDNGQWQLVTKSVINIQDQINSWRDSCDMSVIIQKLMDGDTSVLNVQQGMYGDFTNMPKSTAEALQLVINAQNKWKELPLEVRNKFDNSFESWFASSSTEPWLEKMGFLEKEEINEKEVISDES